MRRYLTLSLCLVAISSAGAALAADPFLSPPGAAERAAAGATVAGRGSLASVWHNPATLVDTPSRFEFEWQAAPDRGKDGTLDAGSNAWYLGASFVNRDKWYGAAATGIAAYTPHTMKLWVEQSGEPDSAFGRVNLTTQVIGVPYAVEFEDAGLSLGVVGELVGVDPSGTDLRVQDSDGDVADADLNDDQQVGFSGAVGFRYRVYDEGPTRVDIGGVRRARATSGASVDVDSGTAARLLPDKPGGYDMGLRVRHDLGEQRSIAAKLQHASTDWDSAGKVYRDALGFSLRTPFGESAALQPGERVIRVGYGRSRPRETRSWMDWPEGRVVTAGVAFLFSRGAHLDLTLERRAEERKEFDDERTWFGGFTFGLAY